MATRAQCEVALTRLISSLNELDPQVRAKVLPARTVSLVIEDLDAAFTAKLDASGVTDWSPADPAEAQAAEVRFVTGSDELIRISSSPAAFGAAWVRGRVRVHAGFRDLLELRRLL
jgi:hypothetical protein